MAFREICRTCLSVNVGMFVLKKTSLRNLYKILTNSLMDKDEKPIIVCFTCHVRLNQCRRFQQQAIESNAVLEQLLAGGSTSIPKPHEARNEIQFTPIYHIDIRPVECDIENDCKDEIFSLESVKVEEENFENENFKFEENGNYETKTAEKAEDLEIDALGDRHTDSENDFPLIAFGSKSKEKSKTVKLKKKLRNNKKDDDEQYITPTKKISELSEKKIKSSSTDSNTNNVRKENLDFESPTIIKSNLIMKKNFLKQKSVNILRKTTSGVSTKDILAKHISYSHKTQKNSDTTAVRTQVEQTPVPQLTEIFNCDVCEFKTTQKRYILTHLNAHVAKQVYYCNNCEYKCTRKIDFIYHTKIHTGEKPYSCNICEYRCIKKGHLQTHMKVHSGEKPYLCNICEYKCIQKNNLQIHMKIHTEEKPFSCNVCGYRCITKVYLQKHMKIHTGEKPYSCHICEYRCITKVYLQKHMKIHTREKPYLCHICEYRCITKVCLQRHMKIHPEVKPYSCHICEHRCITKRDLQRHMKIHTGEKKIYSCHICKYRCITNNSLQRHMKIHTGAKPFS